MTEYLWKDWLLVGLMSFLKICPYSPTSKFQELEIGFHETFTQKVVSGESSQHYPITTSLNGALPFSTFFLILFIHLIFFISSRQGSVIADFSVSLLHRYYHGITRLQDAINMDGEIEQTLPVSLVNLTSPDGKPYFLSLMDLLRQ